MIQFASHLRRSMLCASIVVILLAVCALPVNASIVVAGWEMNSLSGFGPSPFNATTAAANITVGGLTRGLGVTTGGSPAANGWGGNGWDGAATAAAAISASNFITFTLSANPGYLLSLTSIDPYNVRRSSTGPTTGQWQYSLDGSSFTDIGGPITWGIDTTATGNSQSAINLSGISLLQNLADAITVTFRLVNYNASASGGNWYLNQFQTGNDFIVNGDVAVVPEASALLVWTLLCGTVLGGWKLRRILS